MSAKTSWLYLKPEGLYCEAGDFYIDPLRPVARAVITHGHSDHARSGHRKVLGTPETLAIMRHRMAEAAGQDLQSLSYGQVLQIGGVQLRLVPAGHVLGSAQVVLEHDGTRIVISGDYKRRPDPTCPSFEPVMCDLFITEATFGLPVFRHPTDRHEIDKLFHSLRDFPERAHLVGAYALGKAQRVLKLLRQFGYERPIWLHGAIVGLTDLYRSFGQDFGELRLVSEASKADLAGAIVIAPPSAIADRWSRRLPEPVAAMASGWMGVRARARQRGAELPLVISDHADWDELTATMLEVQAPEIWITHGREEALVHFATQHGIRARALSIAGYEEEE